MAIALLIRDGSPDWWASTDIWVVPGTDPNGTPGTPVVGNQAYLWATVTNEGDQDASQVQVDFWVADPSLEIRKSTANHIGTAYADVAAGTSQAVLCLVPWRVTLVNGGHECVVVEASSAADPLSPPPADPDVLDALTYRQIAQHNLSVMTVSGKSQHEINIGVHAGLRADKNVEVRLDVGGELSQHALALLGVEAKRSVGAGHVSAALSERSLCGEPNHEERNSLHLRVPRGTSASVWLNVAARERLTPEQYAVIRVVELQNGRVAGGLSLVVVGSDTKRKGAAQ